MKRRSKDDLRAAASSVAFTPGARDLPGLVELLDEEESGRVAEAILRAGLAGAEAVARALDGPTARRPALLRLLARFVEAQPAWGAKLAAPIEARLEDQDAATRRAAARALGRLGAAGAAPGAEQALLQALARATRPEERRALVDALGRAGGAEARAAIEALDAHAVPAEARAQAMRVLRRNQTRDRAPAANPDEPASPIAIDRAPPSPLEVALYCRRGLEPLLAAELSSLGAEARGVGRVALRLASPLATLFAARTFSELALPLPVERGAIPEAVARALDGQTARTIFASFAAAAPVRYRIDWAGPGRRRAEVLRCVAAIARRRPELIDDPSQRGWEVRVRPVGEQGVLVELLPRLADPRFAYRVRDVPAASHPTVAAALARLGGVRSGDVVWDPFVGSGAELVERSLLGPFARLVGSDVDDDALGAAQANLTAAAVDPTRYQLLRADAGAGWPLRGAERPTLILTNPPMGRRVHRSADLPALLDRFVTAAAAALAPAGRLVWVSPTRNTAERLRALALSVEEWGAIDLGGFDGYVQIARKL